MEHMKPIKLPPISPQEVFYEILALLGVLAMTGVLATGVRLCTGKW